MKTVLDSVHGTIEIPEVLFEKVIDTPYFQRLRRIEQNSCRSVYPSARHDRFIHSLGVYHLGDRIACHIERECGPSGKDILPDNYKLILDTYRLACLLHDVGHTPFSHTFEDYFDLDKSLQSLKNIVADENFTSDVDNGKASAPHEAISAYVAISVFKDKFDENEIDWQLLVRMITGYKYLIGKDIAGNFENVMIELIHGDIIDADGLDYVCRDVWAGGYKSFNIDLKRLINSIYIERDKEGNYFVLYKSKALNEIEMALNVKNFQHLYVIMHHKVLLEQYYLTEGMKSAASYHLGIECHNADERDNALRTLCDLNIFLKYKILNKSKYRLFRPTDDDFVSLMKQVDTNDPYIEQWFSRNFRHQPLWKSKLEYFNIFRSVFVTLSEEHKTQVDILLESPECKRFLCNRFYFKEEDIIVKRVKSKVRSLDANKIMVLLNGKSYPYSELTHDMFSVIGSSLDFCYMYINLDIFGGGDNSEHIYRINEALKDFLADGIRHSWD